jgi:CheY-like chemotaxis protein
VPFTSPKPLRPPPPELLGATVLVVDDERAWRVILETDLRLLGYRVSLARDAAEALQRARADVPADVPEVAIVDLMLPEPMDGWALLAALRAQGTRLPVIFYTAYPAFPSAPDDPDVVAYVSKADDRADLYALLPDAISATRRAKSRRS